MKKHLALLLCAVLLPVGCGRKSTAPLSAIDLTPHDAGVETCIACGMVVREQPAPRGQAIHRDGTRVFLCSLGDLLRYLEVPSPHGRAQVIFSETMAVDHALADMDRTWKPWREVSELYFIIDIDRPGTMGEPIMAYETKDAAELAARNFNGEVMSFIQLQQRYAQ